MESDGATAIAGATVTAVHEATKTATTDENGSFTIAGFEKCGVTYKFIISKSTYIDKIVTGAEREAAQEAGEGIVLEAAGTGAGTISGTVVLGDDPAPYDYTNGYVTFWVDSLSAFGIGSVPTDETSSGGGGGCFVATAKSKPDQAQQMAIVLGILMALSAMVLARLKRNKA